MENRIKDLIIEGKTVNEISVDINVSPQSVYKSIKKHRWKGLINTKKSRVLKLIRDGMSDEDIIKKMNVSISTIYRIKKDNNIKLKKKTKKVMSSWSADIMLDIKLMSKKYQSVVSGSGCHIDLGDIESVLIDLIIHTDLKNIKNKDAYFRKYAPLKISNLKSSKLSKDTDPLFYEESNEEIYGNNLNPEYILIVKDEYSQKLNSH